MKKIDKDALVIIEIKVDESKDMLKVTTEDNTVHYFPNYAFEFLLKLIKSCKDVSNVMEYADLLNHYMLSKKIENMMVDDEETI